MDNIVRLKRSSVFGKAPLPSQIEIGELCLNFNSSNPFLSFKDSENEIQKFLSENKVRNLIADVKNDVDASFYTKAQINQMFEDLESGGTIDLDDYYTKIESDAKYQTLSGMSSYLTVAQAEQDLQPKGDYALVSQLPDLTDYALKSDLDDYLTIASASTIYATKEELEEHIPTVDAYTKAETDALLQGKSDTGHTHDYETLTNKPDLSNFATKGEIPDTSSFATKQELANYMPNSGMTSYLTIAQAEQDLQPKGDYALQSEIPDVSNFITSGYAEETFAKKGDVPTDVYTKSETDTLLAGKASSSHTHDYSEILNTPDVPKIWKGTLSEYTNLTDIDSDTLYVITDESEQFVTSGDVESMISGFTTLSEVQVELEGYSQTDHTHSQYLTQTSADSRYARVVSCTQAEYDALVQNDQVEQGVLYCITESN